MHALAAHHRKLAGPEGIPKGVVCGIGDASIEARLIEVSSVRSTDGLGETLDIIVRIVVTERLSNGVEQVLAIDKGDGALFGGFNGHEHPLK